jgi:hypothetical protein
MASTPAGCREDHGDDLGVEAPFPGEERPGETQSMVQEPIQTIRAKPRSGRLSWKGF